MLQKKTAYFEVDFSEIKNNFELIECSDNISDNKDNKFINIYIAFSAILICVYFIIKKKKYKKIK